MTDAPARQYILIAPAFDAEAFFTEMAGLMQGGVPDRDSLNASGKIERPGYRIGIGGIDTLDDLHLLRGEVLVPPQLLQHRESEFRISVLDLGTDRIRALGQQVVQMTPDRGRREPEPAAERGGGGRPEFQDEPRNLGPRGSLGCSDVFHNTIVP